MPSSRASTAAQRRTITQVRLACSGLVERDAGSVAAAGFLVLRELVSREIHVDLYAEIGYVPRPKGLPSERFEYVGFKPPRWIAMLPPKVHLGAKWLFSPVIRRSWAAVYGAAARERHRAAPYDALVSLGTAPYFTIPGVPTVTWLQGPAHTEVDALKRLRRVVVDYEGRGYYWGLRAYYAPRRWLDRGLLKSSDVLICPSQWAQRELAGREVAKPVLALPYPVDLDLFRPSATAVDWGRPEIVSLGRLVPRKRLDLMIDAFPFILNSFPDARLKIVGSPAYAPGQIRLIEQSPCRQSIDYVPRMARAQVVGLLQRAAVVVQTSENENFGSAIAEAQACGTPVVVGPSNGTADYIDTTASRVFERYEPRSVADAVTATLEARRRAPATTRQDARANAERNFAVATVVDQFLDAIALAQTRRRPPAEISQR
jgi:glycosyltransferase involved in cell wall biosynthesis